MLLIGLEKRKRTNRENPRTIPEQIGKIPEKSGMSQKCPDKKGQKRTKRVQIGKPPGLKPPCLAALGDLPEFFRRVSRFLRPRLRGTNLRDKRQSAVFCGFLRRSAVSCENLRFPNACFPGKGENQRKSARICENLRWARFVP